MQKIVIGTGIFPSSLILEHDIDIPAPSRLGGGFANVYQGKRTDGAIVALKVLRSFANETEEEKARSNAVSTLRPYSYQ